MSHKIRLALIACALLVASATASQAAVVRVRCVPRHAVVAVRTHVVVHPYFVHPVRRIYVRSVPVVRTVPVMSVWRPAPRPIVTIAAPVYPRRVVEVVTHRWYHHPRTVVYIGRHV